MVALRGQNRGKKEKRKKIFDHMKTREVTVQKKTIDATYTQTIHMAKSS